MTENPVRRFELCTERLETRRDWKNDMGRNRTQRV
jgi:hypothetical protein